MNSYSYELKREVAGIMPTGDDESLSQLSAIIKSCGEIIKNGRDIKVIVFTELLEVADLISEIIKHLYGAEIKKDISNLAFSKKQRYEVVIPSEISSRVLIDTNIMEYDEDKYLQFVSGVSKYMVSEESTELAFLRGAFVGAFSCNINIDERKSGSTGYHAEFVFSNQTFAQDFCFLLADFDIISKMTNRAGAFVVYVTGLDMVSDLLALVGASKGVLKLQNEGVVRAVRNNINRQNNCISANLTKTVDTSLRELDAIKLISQKIGLESLDEALQEASYLRLANPEESLENLVKLSTKKISKSGLYHRFKKIEAIADKLK